MCIVHSARLQDPPHTSPPISLKTFISDLQPLYFRSHVLTKNKLQGTVKGKTEAESTWKCKNSVARHGLWRQNLFFFFCQCLGKVPPSPWLHLYELGTVDQHLLSRVCLSIFRDVTVICLGVASLSGGFVLPFLFRNHSFMPVAKSLQRPVAFHCSSFSTLCWDSNLKNTTSFIATDLSDSSFPSLQSS